MKISVPIWTWGFVVLAAITSLYSISLRHKVEAKNKAVALAVEWPGIQDAIASSGGGIEESLAKLKQNGLGMVVLPEETVGSMMDRGQVIRFPGNQLGGDPIALEQVREGLSRRGVSSVMDTQTLEAPTLLVSNLSPDALKLISVGLPAEICKTIRDANLLILARHSNYFGITSQYIEQILEDSKAKGAVGYLPQGDQVLGVRAQIKDTAEELRALGMYYVSPEFAKMTGETTMLLKSADNTVRLHAIQAAEIDKMSPGEVVERYARAFSERNQRILLVRPFEDSGIGALQSLSQSLSSVAKAIHKEQGALAAPRPWSDPKVPFAVTAIIMLSVVGMSAGLLMGLTSLSGLRLAGLAGLVIIFAYSLYKQDGSYLATLGAVVTPILAFLLALNSWRRPAILIFVAMSLVSLVGGLCIAGLLNGPVFYVRADTFFAVKLAHFLPIVVVGMLALRSTLSGFDWMKNPITYGATIIGMLVLIGLAFMMARTGNDNPAAVSGFELQLRSLLEKFLVVRPRTKEFLFGHPAMFVGLSTYFIALRSAITTYREKLKIVGLALITAGMIGQTSIVNTMCHLHTPVIVGLFRITIGLILGLVFGAIIWLVVRPRLARDLEVVA